MSRAHGSPGPDAGDEAALEAEFAAFRQDFLSWETEAAPAPETPLAPEVATLIARLQAGDFAPVSSEAEAFALLDEPPLAGKPGRLGAFEIERLVASGGMGVVFAGCDPALGREVAVKVLTPSLKTDEAARRRFRGETRALAALDHPHILPIHSVHEKDGLLFFVMPLVRGFSLAGRVAQEGALPGKAVAEIGRQAARALAAAHAQGLVHRDLKPGNLLLDDGGRRVRIADFGLATLEGEAGCAAGTPDFMAPEQRRGEAVTARADLYGLGATLFFALTGQPPKPGLKTPVLPARTPRWLARLVQSLLAEDPAQRPVSAAAVAETFERSWRRKTRWSLAAALLLGIALAAALPAAVSPLGLYGWWNRALASFSDNKFHVEGRPGVHPTLKRAAQAANGRTVLVDFDGERPQPAADFGTFPVVLRAAPGRHPVLAHQDQGAPLFSTRAALRIEGLGFQRTVPDGQVTAPFVRTTDAPLMLSQCRMAIVEMKPGKARELYSPPLLLIGTASATLVDCEVDAGQEPWAVIRGFQPGAGRPPVRLNVAGSRVRGAGLFMMRSPGLRAEVELHGSSFICDLAFAHWTQRGSHLRVAATDCEFTARRGLIWIDREDASDAVEQAFSWHGQGNHYSFPATSGPPFLRVARGPSELEIFSFEGWQNHPAVQEAAPAGGETDAGR